MDNHDVLLIANRMRECYPEHTGLIMSPCEEFVLGFIDETRFGIMVGRDGFRVFEDYIGKSDLLHLAAGTKKALEVEVKLNEDV